MLLNASLNWGLEYCIMVLFQRQINQCPKKKLNLLPLVHCKRKDPDQVKTDLNKQRVYGQMEIAARSCMWNCGSFIPDSPIPENAEDVINILRVQLRICRSVLQRHFHADDNQHVVVTCRISIFLLHLPSRSPWPEML